MKSENSKISKQKLVGRLFQVELLEMDEFKPCVTACQN